jgi:predicted esterase
LLETADLVPGWGGDPDDQSPITVQVAGPVRYAVVLPPEYTPTRSYPMLVALRPAEWNIERAAEFWGVGRDGAGHEAPGPATRAGYVVIAPEYAAPKQADYGYTAREHEAVLAAILDARKRFIIDSDRVYLTGHGMGGDATFDIAMAHPDQFAGVVPISGLSRYFTKYYWPNAKLVPFYVVNGELDRAARSVSASDMKQMMTHGHDVLFCEYVGRGYEYYQEELANVLAWTGRMRRAADPKEVDANVLRTSDDRFYWVGAEGIPRAALLADVANAVPKAGIRPMTLSAGINQGNIIRLGSAATRYVLRLNGTLVDLDQRVQVKIGGRRVFNDFLVPDTAALLDDLAENGDRQRLYPVRLVVE